MRRLLYIAIARLFNNAVLIKITPEGIKNGKQGSRLYCPVALAMSHDLGQEISVGVAYWKLNTCRTCQRYKLPRRLRRVIKHYDETGEMSPTTFWVVPRTIKA